MVLSNLERSVDGAYHDLKVTKGAQCHVSETQWRFNLTEVLDTQPALGRKKTTTLAGACTARGAGVLG